MEERYCVYKHTAPNGKVYIGITKREPEVRWGKTGSGYATSPHFYSAIQKYGWEHIQHEVLTTGLSKEEACLEEKRLIAEYNSADPNFGYNNTLGGETGLKITEDVKRKIGNKTSAFYSKPENREMLRQRALGYKHTDEAKQKMRAAKLGRHTVLSNSHKQHISEGRKKRIESDDAFRKELATAWADVGRKQSKRIQQFTKDGCFIAEYESSHEAERKTGVRSGNISKCCRGLVNTAGGYIWRYAN